MFGEEKNLSVLRKRKNGRKVATEVACEGTIVVESEKSAEQLLADMDVSLSTGGERPIPEPESRKVVTVIGTVTSQSSPSSTRGLRNEEQAAKVSSGSPYVPGNLRRG